MNADQIGETAKTRSAAAIVVKNATKTVRANELIIDLKYI